MPASFSPSSPSTASSLASLRTEEILPSSPAPSLAGAQPTVPVLTPPAAVVVSSAPFIDTATNINVTLITRLWAQ